MSRTNNPTNPTKEPTFEPTEFVGTYQAQVNYFNVTRLNIITVNDT